MRPSSSTTNLVRVPDRRHALRDRCTTVGFHGSFDSALRSAASVAKSSAEALSSRIEKLGPASQARGRWSAAGAAPPEKLRRRVSTSASSSALLILHDAIRLRCAQRVPERLVGRIRIAPVQIVPDGARRRAAPSAAQRRCASEAPAIEAFSRPRPARAPVRLSRHRSGGSDLPASICRSLCRQSRQSSRRARHRS